MLLLLLLLAHFKVIKSYTIMFRYKDHSILRLVPYYFWFQTANLTLSTCCDRFDHCFVGAENGLISATLQELIQV